MKTVVVHYKNEPDPKSFDVLAWEVHTYGFLELVGSDRSLFINLDNIASFDVPVPVPSV